MNPFPRNVLDRLRIIETREVVHEWYEICATGRATYDEEMRRLEVVLHAFLRRIELRGKDTVLHPEWLPHPDRVTMGVSFEEAPDAAGEVFDSWARKVAHSIPAHSQWQPGASWLHAPTGRNLEAMPCPMV